MKSPVMEAFIWRRTVMPLCRSCEPLIEASTELKPHAFLSRYRMKRQPEGSLEWFLCGACSTVWERFRTRPHIRGTPQFWKIIRASLLQKELGVTVNKLKTTVPLVGRKTCPPAYLREPRSQLDARLQE
jgi:hypothetical protein